ncbi:MAG: hypothetical protein ACRD5L_01540, partial [Bryobacteraceae bacterium]
ANLGRADFSSSSQRASAGPAGFQIDRPIRVSPGWKSANLRAVVFLQDPHNKKVFAAGELKF